jgi:antitoxin MazE
MMEEKMNTVATLTLQQWGNSLAVRIPAAIARTAHFSVGQAVEVSVDEYGVVVKAVDGPKHTLAQKLALYDVTLHSGEAIEAMATSPVGVEEI